MSSRLDVDRLASQDHSSLFCVYQLHTTSFRGLFFIRHPPVLQPVGTLFLCIFVVDGRSPEIRIPSLKAGYFERVSKLDKQESSLMEIYNDAKTVFALNADPRQCYFEDLNLPLQSESWVFIDVLTVA